MRKYLLVFLIPALACLAQSPAPVSRVNSVDTVPGQPFMAAIEVKRVQTLLDGNHVVTMALGRIARDSQGRVRQDLPQAQTSASADASAARFASIYDPVAGFAYLLDAHSHTARKRLLGAAGYGPAPPSVRAASAGGPSPQPQVPASTQNRDLRTSTTSESLGAEVIEGVSADGERTTRTIPEGQAGNEQPMAVTLESWFSAELRAVVLTRSNDPRTGEVTRKLTNIQRIEPPASLFDVPPDYKIIEPESPQN